MKLISFFISLFLLANSGMDNNELNGAWKSVKGEETTVILIKDGYFTSTTYTSDTFKGTSGGLLKSEKNKLIIEQEFNTAEKDLKKQTLNYQLKGNTLEIENVPYSRIDDGQAPLAGVWKITGRMEDGKINQIHQRGTRKTLKMLTGSRFQWFAIDPDGNKFSGTGGGTYSFKDGKYIENIEFFSRDASRIGASLSFDDHLEDGKWHHSGLSSRGDKIYEIWEKAY